MKNEVKPKILVFCDYYLPGYKSGGGMRTIVNMVDRLHERYDFWIVTRDHDGPLDKGQYENVEVNRWNLMKNAQVYYLDRKSIRISKLRELILKVEPDALYANSFFASLAIIVLKLRLLKLIPNLNAVIAPCGELSVGALMLKPVKKKLFLSYSRLSGLYRNVLWKASSELERNEILRVKGKGGKIFIAPDLPPKTLVEDFSPDRKPSKTEGEATMIFLSRFMRKKNFKWLLENLTDIKGRLTIDIFGPLEDADYWEECVKLIDGLASTISVNYLGPIPYEQVGDKLLEYQFFILPTISENFGHVFLEALAAGCPLIISDRTPWLDLPKEGIGWDLPLEQPDKWREVINSCIAMDSGGYQAMSARARGYSVKWLTDEKIERDTMEILDHSVSNV